jgi:hypothetical protein
MIDYLEQGRSINGTYYTHKLRHLAQLIARKSKGKLTQGVLPHAQAHTSQVAILEEKFIKEKGGHSVPASSIHIGSFRLVLFQPLFLALNGHMV